jgi:hypothetical protein
MSISPADMSSWWLKKEWANTSKSMARARSGIPSESRKSLAETSSNCR